MKITYAQNPLYTTVELDDHDREICWLKIKIEALTERLVGVECSLEDGQYFDLEDARRECNSAYYTSEDEQSPLDKAVDCSLEYYVKALKGSHDGDCTCVPMSCAKCHAESILSVNTLAPWPGKHELNKIKSAFTYKDGEEWKQRSLYEAVEHLKYYIVSRVKPDTWVTFTQEDYDQHIPRWEAEARGAYAYLLNYAKIHFPQVAV